jgi:hypothetical protein
MILNDFPETAKVWLYQSDRAFTTAEKNTIAKQLQDFINEWAAHGTKLKAQGELVGIKLFQAFHRDHGEGETRNILLIPKSAHGTNPATATMAGCKHRIHVVDTMPDAVASTYTPSSVRVNRAAPAMSRNSSPSCKCNVGSVNACSRREPGSSRNNCDTL